MTWFSNLFKKEKIEISEADKIDFKIKWDGYVYFEKGKKDYVNNESEKAQINFDLALKNEFEKNFQTEIEKLYFMRAWCLQSLKYDFDAIKDFDKAIEYSPDDCNNYFCRSISKGSILDYEGQVADLEKAIKLSELDNELNATYKETYEKNRGESDFAFIFRISLVSAKMDIDSELKKRVKIENATTPELKTELEKESERWNAKLLAHTKRRQYDISKTTDETNNGI